VEKGDILTLFGGLLIVLIIAKVTPTPTPIPVPVPTVIHQTPVTPVYVEPTPTLIPADAPPYQIFYTDKPFTYPVFKLPENMETYGASDIIARNQEMVPFAFVSEKRGGLTQVFSVPYPYGFSIPPLLQM